MSEYVISNLKYLLNGGSHPEIDKIMELIRNDSNIKNLTNIISIEFVVRDNIQLNIDFKDDDNIDINEDIDISLKLTSKKNLLEFLPHLLAFLSTPNILDNLHVYTFTTAINFYREMFEIICKVFDKPDNIDTLNIICGDHLKNKMPDCLLSNVDNLVLDFIDEAQDLENIIDKINGVQNIYIPTHVNDFNLNFDKKHRFPQLVRLGKFKYIGLGYNKIFNKKLETIETYNILLDMPTDTIPNDLKFLGKNYLVYDLSEFYTDDILVKGNRLRGKAIE